MGEKKTIFPSFYEKLVTFIFCAKKGNNKNKMSTQEFPYSM